MGGLIGIGIPIPANPARPTLRELARLIIAAREIERMHTHAIAEKCVPCDMLAHHGKAAVQQFFPRRYITEAWAHKYIVAPAAREYARKEWSD